MFAAMGLKCFCHVDDGFDLMLGERGFLCARYKLSYFPESKIYRVRFPDSDLQGNKLSLDQLL